MEGAHAAVHVAPCSRRVRNLVRSPHRHLVQEGEITGAHGVVDCCVEPTGNRLILRDGVRTRRRWDLYHHGQEECRSP